MYNIVMEITTEDFDNVIIFQDLETKIREERKKRKRAEEEIKEIENSFLAKKEILDRIKVEYNNAIINQKQMENELSECEDLIKKHQIELNNVRKNDEYKSILKEIENLKNKKDEIENEIIKLLEFVDKKSKEVSNVKNELSKMEIEINKFVDEKKVEINNINKVIDNLIIEQKNIESKIKDDSLKKRIENLIKNKDGMAVVKVNIKTNNALKSRSEELFCGGCNMKLTANDVFSLKKANTFVICQNCSRLIYYRG